MDWDRFLGEISKARRRKADGPAHRPAAYVFLEVERARVDRVFAEVADLPGVSETQMVEGEYQILLRFDAADFETLGDRILVARDMAGVRRTKTMLVHEVSRSERHARRASDQPRI